jgi:hypothetical protein
VNATHLDIGSCRQSRYIVELRLQLVSGAEQMLLASDDEDSTDKNRQRYNNESS